MKPRLKLTLQGDLVLIKPGLTGLTEEETRKKILRHYGSIAEFSRRFRYTYSSVNSAVFNRAFLTSGGQISEIRKVLGLASEPSKHALSLERNRSLNAAFNKASRQLRTSDEAKKSLADKGQTLKDFASQNGFTYRTVSEVVRGVNKGLHGEGHKVAVALGMKQGATV